MLERRLAMTSEKQIEANRENAQQSTGPKTPEGKAASRFNAITHGVLRESLTEYEENLYPKYLEELSEELEPKGFLEMILLERVALCYLRLFRIAKIEKEYMQSKLHPDKTKSILDNIANYGVEVIEEGYKPKIDISIISQMEQTINRYEIAIERSLYRAVHELQRLQAARKGEKPPIPLAVDISVNNEENSTV